MKNVTIYLLVLLMSISLKSTGQIETKDILIANENWTKEKLKMPLSFAPEINYAGFEDIRFSKDWANENSPYFWTYTFAWHIKGIKTQTVESLENNLKLYFDGLMLPPNNQSNLIPEATVIFLAVNDSIFENKFIGRIKTYDRFHTKKTISINCEVEAHYCHSQNRSTIVFRLSLENTNHNVWKKLKEVKLVENLCD
ncbi:MAG: hypothetical protein AAF688_05035 [Bacteroidota bacterium]